MKRSMHATYQTYGSMAGTVRFIPPNAARAGKDSVERQYSHKVLVTLICELIGRGQVEIITDPRTTLASLIRRTRSWIRLE